MATVSVLAQGQAFVPTRAENDLSTPLAVSYKVSSSAGGRVDYKVLSGHKTIAAGAMSVLAKVKALPNSSNPAVNVTGARY